ncbi:MAG: hypothetical protein IPL47_13165 [Phyllobacteriaceae bacterium]|nr:hypothetical protein [Phyllobacteriaceae bacterium]
MNLMRKPVRSVAAHLLVALALVLSAFAPQTIAFARGERVDLSTFAFPDGSLPIICLGDTNGESDGDGLVAGVVSPGVLAVGDIPPPPAIGNPSLPVVIGAAAPVDESRKTPAALGLSPPRGPPTFQV